MNGLKKRRPLQSILLFVAVLACLGATGCTYDIAGQNLPSPYYLSDDVQYFAPGPEFILAREAAAQKAYKDGASGVEAISVGEEAEVLPTPIGQ